MNPNTIENYLLGKCSAEESREVERWFVENIDNPELEELCTPVIGRMGAYSDDSAAREAFEHLRRRLALNPGEPRRRRLFRIGFKAAAAALVLGVCVTAAYLSGRGMAEPEIYSPDFVEIAAIGTGSSHTLLPDSSEVVVHPGSRIIYDRTSFGGHRQVMLFGDAYFAVRKGADMPFEVKCHGASVHVMGTRFDVSSHDDDSEFTVALYDGKVSLSTEMGPGRDTITLSPGEIVKVDKATGALSTMHVPDLDNNEDNGGTHVFFERRIADIATELERRTGKHIIIRNPAISSRRVLAIFSNNESPEEILRAVTAGTSVVVAQPDSLTIEVR